MSVRLSICSRLWTVMRMLGEANQRYRDEKIERAIQELGEITLELCGE